MALNSIVCGVTGSEASEKATLAAARMAKEAGAALTLVYVVDASFLYGLTIQLRPEFAEQSLAHLGGHILDRGEEIAQGVGLSVKKVLRRGKILQVLQDVIREEAADVLVVGDEGRTFAEKVLFGGQVVDNVKEIEARTGVPVKVIR